jgi:hypothetical protein
MLFLIEYDRERGKIVSLRDFLDESSEVATNARLELEIRLASSGVRREVVILEAADLESLKLTHNRYFASLSELAVGSRN